nr:type II secretion system protein [Thiomicrorhabdus cannonii]
MSYFTARRTDTSLKGFSLMEMAIALLILGLVIVSFQGIFKLLFDTDHKMREQQSMHRINLSLNTYLSVNGYLPCPDTDGDGREDRVTDAGNSVCADREGGLPYEDIGVPATDAWGESYYYRVHQRAENPVYINQICEPASVLGLSGTRGTNNLWLCPSSNIYYCSASITASTDCDVTFNICDVPCTNSTDPRPTATPPSPPFFHLATPPFGTVSGSLNLRVYNEDGDQLGEGVVAVVVSWGANGDTVNRASCSGGSTEEMENCDNDRDFVDTQTGLDRDFITWITVNQAKTAIIGTRAIR